MGSTRGKFTQDYKDEAVRLVLNSDRPVIEVAKSLGINDSTLRHWVQNAKKDTGGAGGEEQLSASERAELGELRKFKAQAQMDIAFLKKSGELLRERAEVKFEFISAHAAKKPARADGPEWMYASVIRPDRYGDPAGPSMSVGGRAQSNRPGSRATPTT